VIRRYVAAEDPRVAAANLVALVLGWNTPFYPLYLLAAGMRPGVWFTITAFPFFVLVPAVNRKYPFWGRVLLVAIGLGNTLFCTWLLGEASGTQLFLLPCITLAALLFRRDEPGALIGLLALPVVAGLALDGRYPMSPYACSGAACGGIVWLNAVSVAVLTVFLGWLAAGLQSGVEPARR
jgi:hypothetical protein